MFCRFNKGGGGLSTEFEHEIFSWIIGRYNQDRGMKFGTELRHNLIYTYFLGFLGSEVTDLHFDLKNLKNVIFLNLRAKFDPLTLENLLFLSFRHNAI